MKMQLDLESFLPAGDEKKHETPKEATWRLEKRAREGWGCFLSRPPPPSRRPPTRAQPRVYVHVAAPFLALGLGLLTTPCNSYRPLTTRSAQARELADGATVRHLSAGAGGPASSQNRAVLLSRSAARYSRIRRRRETGCSPGGGPPTLPPPSASSSHVSSSNKLGEKNFENSGTVQVRGALKPYNHIRLYFLQS